MSSLSYHPNQAGQGQTVTQSEANPPARVQGCPCPLCSVTRDNDQPTQRIIEDRDPWQPGVCTSYCEVARCYSDHNLLKVFAVPYVNQVLDNAPRIITVATMNDPAHTPSVSQQTRVCSYVLCYIRLKLSSRETRRTLVTHLYRRYNGLSKSRPVQVLIRLKSLT